jgi:hypothetical protein
MMQEQLAKDEEIRTGKHYHLAPHLKHEYDSLGLLSFGPCARKIALR